MPVFSNPPQLKTGRFQFFGHTDRPLGTFAIILSYQLEHLESPSNRRPPPSDPRRDCQAVDSCPSQHPAHLTSAFIIRSSLKIVTMSNPSRTRTTSSSLPASPLPVDPSLHPMGGPSFVAGVNLADRVRCPAWHRGTCCLPTHAFLPFETAVHALCSYSLCPASDIARYIRRHDTGARPGT